jgi:hypothetical protein
MRFAIIQIKNINTGKDLQTDEIQTATKWRSLFIHPDICKFTMRVYWVVPGSTNNMPAENNNIRSNILKIIRYTLPAQSVTLLLKINTEPVVIVSCVMN